MLKILAIAVAGGFGTLSRYFLGGLVHRFGGDTFPLATLVVNLVGCFFIGMLTHMVREHQSFTPETRVVLIVGLLGGFTTFSAFGYETLELLRVGAVWPAALNVCGNVVVGICAVWFGSLVARTIII